MLKYILDTNIAIYVIKRRPPEVLATFNQHAGQLCISSIINPAIKYIAN